MAVNQSEQTVIDILDLEMTPNEIVSNTSGAALQLDELQWVLERSGDKLSDEQRSDLSRKLREILGDARNIVEYAKEAHLTLTGESLV